MKTIIASGYFDPIHAGHVEYLKTAKNLGDKLIVIVNNDKQAILKKGYFFMPAEDRIKIIKALVHVDEAVISMDEDSTVCNTLEMLFNKYDNCVLAKGGDRFANEIPEAKICLKYNVPIIDGLGEKIRSSSELVKEYNYKLSLKNKA